MAIRVAINGFGRIGKLVYRAGYKNPNLDFVAVNDVTDTKVLAHLLKYDSVHGTMHADIKSDGNKIIVDGKSMEVFCEKDPTALPWKKLGIDIVVESTGKFSDGKSAMKHIEAGAKQVLLSAPAKKSEVPVQTIVLGVNDEQMDCNKYKIFSIGSCTTNGLAPIVKVINDTFGIRCGLMTTIHAYTNDQRLLDSPHKDLRRARAAAMSMIPTSTGAAKAIALVLPELAGKLDGVSVRVPVCDGSLVDLVCETEKEISVESVNAAIKKLAEGKMKRYIEYCEDPIVSCDVIGNSHSTIFDALSTMVTGKNLLKVFSWYDNEWGFSLRMVEMMELMCK
ncbi:MAG: type I glyceraldehyde-3-phosphate dehydrogenase [candidate division Zixibacteria bacterium RBG_16_43_9]|nr:MAG: type I glyceraldehyde-3-phosphate dehydrogenase [candidate division Zixibacteria bacterium RBG_16_43_9]